MSNFSWRDRYNRSKSIVRRTVSEYNKRPELKAYLEILLTLTAISLFGIFAIRPTLKTIGILFREIKEKERVLATMETKIENLRSAKSLYTRDEEKIKLVYEAIPESPAPDKLLLQIEELVYKNQVEISALSMENITIIGESKDQKQTNEKSASNESVSFTMGIEGSYQNLINLIKDIESLRRPVKFSSIGISSIQNDDLSKLTLSLTKLESPYREKQDINIK